MVSTLFPLPSPNGLDLFETLMHKEAHLDQEGDTRSPDFPIGLAMGNFGASAREL